MRKSSKFLWGIMLVLLAVFIVLKSFGVVDTLFFNGWWTLFIIIPSFYGLLFNHSKLTDAFFLLSGVALLAAANQKYTHITYKNASAIIIALVLLDIAANIFISGKLKPVNIPNLVEGARRYVGVFGGCKEAPHVFSGGTAVAVFGGVDLDLRNAVVQDGTRLNVYAVFGGIDIITDDNVNVIMSVSGIFGGSENKQPEVAGNPTIYIDGIASFGGVDVKRKPRTY